MTTAVGTATPKPVPNSKPAPAPAAANHRQRQQLATAGFLKSGGDVLAATKAFQKSWKLPETGLVDSRTAARLQQVETRIKTHLKKHEFFASIGQRSAGVRVDEQRLAALGYDVGAVDGVYDRKTAAAVQQFRKDQGELKDGAPYLDPKAHAQLAKEISLLAHAPERTRVKPTGHQNHLDALTAAAASKDIGVGAKGEAVLNLQKHLLRAGYQTKHANGIFDGRTMAALKAFQSHSGLAPTGKLNAATWAKLKKSYLLTSSPTAITQSKGERSGAVLRSERMLKRLGYKLNPDGLYTTATANAVKAFQKKHHLHVSGMIGGGTLRALERATASLGGTSARGKAQMRAMVKVARARAGGRYPEGWCLASVWQDIKQVGYGKLPGAFGGPLAYAYQFAEWLNQGNNCAKAGLKRLKIDNPYKAPPGAIIVVRAGTPGTHHPFAGDIVVKGEGNHLYNDGEMGYGGSGNFYKGNNYVLGVYVPA